MAENHPWLQEALQVPKTLNEMSKRRKGGLSPQLTAYETPPMMQLRGAGPMPACGEESTEREAQAHRIQLVVSKAH